MAPRGLRPSKIDAPVLERTAEKARRQLRKAEGAAQAQDTKGNDSDHRESHQEGTQRACGEEEAILVVRGGYFGECESVPVFMCALGSLALRSASSARAGRFFVRPALLSRGRSGAPLLCSCSSSAAASTPTPDAVIVPAGGLLPDGQLPEWVIRRLDLAVAAYRSAPAARKPVILCSGGGTPHKPPVLTTNGYVIHEGTACTKHVLRAGVPASALLKEARVTPPCPPRRAHLDGRFSRGMWLS